MALVALQAHKDDTEWRAEQDRKFAARPQIEVGCPGCPHSEVGVWTLRCIVCGLCCAPCTLGLSLVPGWLLAMKGQHDLEQQMAEGERMKAAFAAERMARAKKSLLAGPVKTKAATV